MNPLPIKQTIKSSLHKFGHYARRLARDRFPGVLVLGYHGVRPDDLPTGSMPFEELHVRASELEAHCRLLKDLCHPISPDDWRQAIAGTRSLPERPVLLTFDDGYRSVHSLARPILLKHQIPAVVFLHTVPIEHRRLFWYDACAIASDEAEAERKKYLPYSQLQEFCRTLSRDVREDSPIAPLTIEEVKELAATPGIEIGGHSATHSILACATVEEQRDEILRNRQSLESWTGKPVRAFAYPNGQPVRDYTAETMKLLDELGFDLAFNTDYNFAPVGEHPLEKPRFLMLAGISAAELAHRICFSWRR